MLARWFAAALFFPMSLCCGSRPEPVASAAVARVPGFGPQDRVLVSPVAASGARAVPPAALSPALDCAPIPSARGEARRLPSPIGVNDIQDRSGSALSRFYTALSSAAAGRGIARIMFFGDSHVAADVMTGRIRRNLQLRFGDAGVGFVMPAKPAPWYRHAQADFAPASGWGVVSLRKSRALGPYSGPAGFALQSTGAASAAVRLRPGEAAPDAGSRVELFYLRQPDGGQLRAAFDGQTTKAWSTAGSLGPAYSAYAVAPPPHKIDIDSVGDGLVTLFGLTLEHGEHGVVLDTLGIPGARIRDLLLWDEALYRDHLVRRDPALVVLAYGTNEAMDSAEPIETLERQLRLAIARVHDAVPTASCLLIGPSDHPQAVGRSFRARRRTPLVVKAQRRIAAEAGCGYIDLVAVTGGPMSMMRLVPAGLGARDRTHFTRRGYEALGDAITAALLDGYGDWQKTACSEARAGQRGARSRRRPEPRARNPAPASAAITSRRVR